MNHHIAVKEIKVRFFFDNPVPKNVKGAPVVDFYFTEFLFKNIRVLTLNHESTLKTIPDNLSYV